MRSFYRAMIALSGGALFYLYFGFLYPQPAPGAFKFVFLIGIPVLCGAALALWWAARSGRIQREALLLILVGTWLGSWMAFDGASLLYYKRTLHPDLRRYHPYLQLAPPDFSAKADHSAEWIFTLGGSSTEWADKKGRDWPSRVEEKLHKAWPNLRPRVFNGAKEWYTTQHTLINYILNLRRYHPRVLLVMHAINDLVQNADFGRFSAGGYRTDYGHFLGAVSDLTQRTDLWFWLASRTAQVFHYRPPETVDTFEFPGLADFERNLLTLLQIAALDGVQVVLMTEPNLYRMDLNDQERSTLYALNVTCAGPSKRWSLASAWRGMRAYNDRIREIAVRQGVPLIDLEQVVPKSLEYFTDDVHYQDRTFDLIAEEVTQGLIKSEVMAHLREAPLHEGERDSTGTVGS